MRHEQRRIERRGVVEVVGEAIALDFSAGEQLALQRR